MTKELRVSIGGGLVLAALLLVLMMPGCTKIPNGGVPIYLQIDSPTVVQDNIAGSVTSRIPDAYVTTGNTDLGGYEMPVRVPILTQGDALILVSAGIYDNGIISARAEYPFYRPDTFTIHNAVPGQVYIHHPVYHYFSDVQHGILQDFNAGTGFDANMSLATGIDADSLPNLPKQCGQIVMGTQDTQKITIQSTGNVINTNGREAYMELNFKKSNTNENMPFDVGIEAISSTGTITYYTLITIFPDTKWKKTYLNFSSFLGNNQGSTFKVYFAAYKNAGSTGTVYLDNVKLLYFN